MTVLHLLNQLGMVRMLASGPLITLASGRRGIASIFMLHRFGTSVRGHDPLVLRRFFRWLRRNHFELLDLEELLRRLAGDGAPLSRAVAFTIDDGYLCQAEVAAPLFSEHGVPVTTFLTTGFVDGALWLWWDQVEYILHGTRLGRLEFTAAGRALDLELGSPDRRRAAIQVVTGSLKALPEAERLAGIARLSERAGVPVPESPPPDYRPMTWEQVRRCEAAGMRFGPHTVTHPILARTENTQARREIAGSWQRLREEVAKPVPVFCYPNGRGGDFGAREIAIIRGLGLLGAVTAEPGYATDEDFSDGEALFRVPRFSFMESHDENLRYASGLERLWQRVRRLA